MSINERAWKAMEYLGLTSYEIKAYCALLEHGPLSAPELSKVSNVPYTKIYEVLSSLEAKGWIETEHSRPSKFYPKSPSIALETSRIKMENERKLHEEAIISELLPLYEKRGLKERPEIWIVRGEHNILMKINEIFNSCEKELLLAIPLGLDKVSRLLSPIMAELKHKGVSILMLVSDKASDAIIKLLRRWGEVRVRSQMFGGGIVGDARQVILLLGGSVSSSSYLALWSEHPGLAKFAKDYFEFLWKDSKTIKES
ncbi:MAG: helix-turn-helix domain-containing protein [Nitrososphaerales archaeon]